jgi:hypothetical protein
MAPGRQVETTPYQNGISKDEKSNGEIVIGDMEHDGRVILYIIKGKQSRDDAESRTYVRQCQQAS